VEVFSLYVEIWEGVMALAAPTGIAGLPIPPPRTQPTTFLAAAVDEAREQRENPWNTARLLREWVEQELSAMRELVEARTRSKAVAKPRSLGPKVRLLVAVLVDLFPPRGIPGDELDEKDIAAAIRTRLKVTHPAFTFGRTSLRKALKYVGYVRRR
jgi:hypothetical protein